MQSNFLGWLKKFGLAQNILGPVKGQGINLYTYTYFILRFHKTFYKSMLSRKATKLENSSSLFFLFFSTKVGGKF